MEKLLTETPETTLYQLYADKGKKREDGRITIEVKYIKTPQSVTINGLDTPIGPGFQIFLRHRIQEQDTFHKQISFFWPAKDELNKEYDKLISAYLRTLCKAVSNPLELFIAEKFSENVAVQA